MNITLWVARIGSWITCVATFLLGIYFLVKGPDLQAHIMGTLSCWALTAICAVFVWHDYKKIKSSS